MRVRTPVTKLHAYAMNNSLATVSAAASSDDDDPSQWWKFWQWVCSAGVQKTDWQVLWQRILTVPSLLLNLLTAVASSVQTPTILTVSCITVPATTGWHCKKLGHWLLQDKKVTDISQGSVATCQRCGGGTFTDLCITNLLLCFAVKEVENWSALAKLLTRI